MLLCHGIDQECIIGGRLDRRHGDRLKPECLKYLLNQPTLLLNACTFQQVWQIPQRLHRTVQVQHALRYGFGRFQQLLEPSAFARIGDIVDRFVPGEIGRPEAPQLFLYQSRIGRVPCHGLRKPALHLGDHRRTEAWRDGERP
jgi:hypothetical protein